MSVGLDAQCYYKLIYCVCDGRSKTKVLHSNVKCAALSIENSSLKIITEKVMKIMKEKKLNESFGISHEFML